MCRCPCCQRACCTAYRGLPVRAWRIRPPLTGQVLRTRATTLPAKTRCHPSGMCGKTAAHRFQSSSSLSPLRAKPRHPDGTGKTWSSWEPFACLSFAFRGFSSDGGIINHPGVSVNPFFRQTTVLARFRNLREPGFSREMQLNTRVFGPANFFPARRFLARFRPARRAKSQVFNTS